MACDDNDVKAPKVRDTPFSNKDFFNEFSRVGTNDTLHIVEFLGVSNSDKLALLDEVFAAYEGASEDVRLEASRQLDEVLNKRRTACENMGDFIRRFCYLRPETRINTQYEDVWVNYNWDPLKLGTKVAVRCTLSFVAESVNLVVTPKQTLREIFEIFGVPYSFDTLKAAMRTNDWYLHMESTDSDDVTLCFHNYFRTYDFEDLDRMLFHLIDCYVNYLEMIQKMSGVTPAENNPLARLPGYI